MHVARLFDEAGEPIRYYSLFERDTHSDPRYDNGSNNSEETSNNAANNESNTQSSTTQPATRTCKWCGQAFYLPSYDFDKYNDGRCDINEHEYVSGAGYYCSRKCASEACSAEN